MLRPHCDNEHMPAAEEDLVSQPMEQIQDRSPLSMHAHGRTKED